MSPDRSRCARLVVLLDWAMWAMVLFLVVVVLASCAMAPEPWRPCREQPDAVMIITADGQVVNCLNDPDAAAVRPKPKRRPGDPE